MSFYRTSQFGEIIFLKSSGIDYVNVYSDPEDKNKVIFQFEDSDKRQKLTNDFYNHKGKINDALGFLDEIRHVKSIIYNYLNSERKEK